MIKTPYEEGRKIYGIIVNKPTPKPVSKEMNTRKRKKRFGIFTKQEEE